MRASVAVAVKWTVMTVVLLLVAGVASPSAGAAPGAAAAEASAYVPLAAALTPGLSAVPGVVAALGAEPAVDPAAPAATLTVPALTSSVSATARFKVSWGAAPALPSGGYDAFRVEYREPGVDYWLVWQAATTATSAVFPGEPGHAYRFRVAVASSGDPATVGPWTAEKQATVPADEAAFAYLKTWTTSTVSGAYFGKVRSSTVKGATATYKFKGTQGALIAPRGPGLGKVAVYARRATADGWTAYSLVKTIDLYARASKQRVATTFGSWDPTVQRQVKFLVTGTKNAASSSIRVRLDGFAAYGAPRATTFHSVDIQPETPSVVVTEQLQLSAGIDDCVDQRVTWAVERYDRFGVAHADGAGAITVDGLYTAPAVPTCTEGEDQRTYWVTARAVANPEQVVGMKQVTVTLGPAPVVDSVSPLSGAVGSTVTFVGSHFADHGGVPQVFFSSLEATVVGYSDTTVTAIVPGGWNTWDTAVTVNVAVVTAGQWSTTTSSHLFTVTGILPMAPRIDPGDITPSDAADSASPGDEIEIWGRGFAPVAADNLIRFGGGVVAAAARFEPDPYWEHYGRIWVTVPDGAETGPLGTYRLDGDGVWYVDNPVLEVRPALVVTAALHPSYQGFFTGPRFARIGSSWGYEDWLIQGGDFTQLRENSVTSSTGHFFMDVRRDGVTSTIRMRAASATLAVADFYRDEPDVVPDAVFADAQPGDVIALRIRGVEAANQFERTSPWFSVTLGDLPVYGAVEALPAAEVGTYWGPSYTVAKGSWLRLFRGATQSTQVLTAPGLWPGTLPLGEGGLLQKLVRLDTPGDYTITNQTSGESTQLVVGDIGEYRSSSYSSEATVAEGLLMNVAGAVVDVPPGALSVDDLSGWVTQFTVSLHHDPSDAMPWDATLTDGGHGFSLDIWPHVTRLLQPITVAIPYEAAGRTTVPFLGMWDDASGLYYDFGLSPEHVDTVDHTLTYVIPAGDYPHPDDYYGSAPEDLGAPLALEATPLTGRPFNESFRKAGAVSSKVSTSGDGFVWHPDGHPTWGVRVDAVTDPSSSSYVSPEKAQEVLDVAAATWTNLAGKGWSEPEAMITITVRDYGDPGVYQGATTKAVFGQPWVYINSRLTMGSRLDTAVSHEMGHVFQRQLTTNVSTYWIDEAVAEWVAWDTLGAYSDLRASFEAGCDFPAAAFPTTFSSGYTTEQAYGAGAFIIWLADTYGPAAVLGIYDTLAYEPSYWYDAHGTFREATGRTVPQLVAEFAPEFWLQTYEPIATYSIWSRLYGPISAYTGTQVTLGMAADSSCAASVTPTSEFRASLTGKPMVARAPGLPAGATIEVYRDAAPSGAVPVTPVRIGTLSSMTPVLDLGPFDATVGCYRLVAVTPAGAGLTTQVRVEAVHLGSVSPASGAKAGGYDCTLTGSGFGDQSAIVMVGPAVVSGAGIVSWSDTRVVFRMPNMGTETGPQAVQVRPVIGGASNTVTFTTY